MMKKIVFLVTIMVLGLTACEAEKANVSIADETTNVETETDSDSEYVEFIHNEEELETAKNNGITYIEENWEEEGIPSVECKDEIIEMIKSIEYDSNYVNGYDLEKLQVRYVNILVKYEVLPAECMNKTFDEIEDMGYIC